MAVLRAALPQFLQHQAMRLAPAALHHVRRLLRGTAQSGSRAPAFRHLALGASPPKAARVAAPDAPGCGPGSVACGPDSDE
jgi:hypothetical protein